jgi:hypothetical protein
MRKCGLGPGGRNEFSLHRRGDEAQRRRNSDEAFPSHAFADVGLMMLSFWIIASQKLRYEGM